MKPVLSYIIRDATGKIIFDFPSNTLLEKITDVWSTILDYYYNYYPFSIGPNSGYRELTREEFNTKKFIKLFSKSYKEGKIIYNVINAHTRVCVEGHPLCIMDNQIYSYAFYRLLGRCEIGNGGCEFTSIIDDIDKIYVHDHKISGSISADDVPLMVISDFVFD